MKGGSHTRLGAYISMADLLTPKYKIRVGSWNVRTLYQAGKLQQVQRDMTNYKVEILCVSEARWTDSGRRILASGHTIFYSGCTDNIHRGGVAVIVTRKVEKTLLEWKPVNDRLMKVRFNSKFARLTIITCYAPTEEAEEEEKDECYEQLEYEIRTTPRHDVLMVIVDVNARVGDNGKKEPWEQRVLDVLTTMERDSLIYVWRADWPLPVPYVCTEISIKPHGDRQTKGRLAKLTMLF